MPRVVRGFLKSTDFSVKTVPIQMMAISPPRTGLDIFTKNSFAYL
jgi:hypothetical protein